MSNPSREQHKQMTSFASKMEMARVAGPRMEGTALLAAMTFLDVTASEPCDGGRLAAWVDEHVVANGWMPRPLLLVEQPVGCVALRARQEGAASSNMDRLVTIARARVLSALLGFVGTQSEDRFLREALFLGRVVRERSRWVPRPDAMTPLSGVVLGLFAVAILSERPFYERELCVCRACGRVSFDAAAPTRLTCPAHTAHESGFTRKVTLLSAQSVR